MQVWFSNRRAKWRREEKLRHNRHTRSSSSASSNVEPNMSQSAAQHQSAQSGHHQNSQPSISHHSSGLGSPDILGVTSLSDHKFDINSSVTNSTSPSPSSAATAAAAAAAAAAASAAVVVSSSASRIPNPLSSGFANHSLYHTIPQPMHSMADTYR